MASEIDWEGEAERLAGALCQISTVVAAAIPRLGTMDMATLVERGKILGWLHMVREIVRDGKPESYVKLGLDSLPPNAVALIPAIGGAIIEAILLGIEKGEHDHIEVKLHAVGDIPQGLPN